MAERSMEDRQVDMMAIANGLKDDIMSSVNVSCPGIILSFNAEVQTATVQLAIRRRVKHDDGVKHEHVPLLADVPVLFLGGGGTSMTFPVQAGDECLVFFADNCIDAWYQSGGVQNQIIPRMHDISDGFAVVGFRSRPNALNGVNGEKPNIQGGLLIDGHGMDAWTVGMADKLSTARKVQIGDTERQFDGSEDVLWSLEDIGAASENHEHTVSDITDFPQTMPPSEHEHTVSDITDFPTSMPPSEHEHTVSDITDFPQTMPPSEHGHIVSQITDFPTSMPASDVSSWAKAATKPSYTYSEVGAAAASHSHIYLNHPDDDRGSAPPYPNSVARSLRAYFKNGNVLGGTIGNYIGVINFAPWDGDSASTGDCSYQLAFGSTAANGGNPRLAIRNGINTTWNAWNEIVTSVNVGGYAVLPRGQSNWNDTTVINNVVGMLAWKNYGNNHVIFDASNGTSPSGGAVNSTNSANPWSASYPTLMGWNGGSTYGVRVDRARVVDIDAVYPVGAIYMSYASTSPASLFGGTWSALPTGKFLRTGTGGAEGGSDTHVHSTPAVALSVAQLAVHAHNSMNYMGAYTGGGAYNAGIESSTLGYSWGSNTQNTGSGEAHGHGNTGSSSNVPAYYAVYAWRRTA